MPSHWGHTAFNIVSGSSPTGTQVLHAVGNAEAGVIYSRVPQIPDREFEVPCRRAHLRLARRRRDERGRILGSAEHRLHQAPAGALPGRGQRLRDLGAGRSADAGRRHLAAGPIVSRDCTSTRSTAPISSPACGPCASAADYVRARKGPAFVHARVIRPYSHSLSDDEKLYKPPAEREAEARRDPIARFAEFLKTRGARDRRGSGRRSRRTSSAR